MKLFSKKKKVLSIPEGCTADSVRIEASTCTGERTIGFYNPMEKKLMFAELVRTDSDINAFYEKYGIEHKNGRN